MAKKIVMLTGKGDSTKILYHALKSDFTISKVIIEEGIPKVNILKRRMKKIGFFRVMDQLLFQVWVLPFLKLEAKGRRKQILRENNLTLKEIPENVCEWIESVNSETCRNLLKELNPDIVIVNGTRIISTQSLAATHAIFLNTHAGITPKYRGVHGGYWALAQNDQENCGVTVHRVNKGIDTGGILAQATINPEKNDNFITYPLMQLTAGIPLMKTILSEMLNNESILERPNELESRLWSHPGVTGYLFKRFFKGVK